MDYRGIEHIDEWNPHIVHSLNGLSDKQKLFIEDEGSLLVKFDQFISRYNTTISLLKNIPEKEKSPLTDWFPIAYNLVPNLSDIEMLSKDDIEREKFGGIPNLLQLTEFKMPYKQMGESPTVRGLIEKTWPVCKCCGSRMSFLCQVNLSEWKYVISLLTAKTYEQYGNKYGRSAVSSSRKYDGFVCLNEWMYLFACDCFNHLNPCSDASVYVCNKNDLEDDKILEFCGSSKWDKAEYLKEVNEFMLENNIHPTSKRKYSGQIPLQFVSGFELGFEFDYWGSTHIWEYAAESKELESFFDRQGQYKFFGKPSSQQEAYRYVCFNSYPFIHRQSPIVVWGDSEHDVTRQMYGCLLCNEDNKIHAKMDNSCT